MRLPDSLSVLRHRDFRIYWVGQAISLVGTWMQLMAQNWVVTSMSPSATVLGLLSVTGTFPMLVLGLKAGSIADRFDKRRILIATQVAMMLLAFVFAAAVFSGRLQLWHVFGFALLLGTAAAFDLPASQAFAPELVDRAQIPKAVAMIQAIFHGGRLVGPALAGLLIQRFGEGSAFVANGLSFVAVIVSLMMIGRARQADAARAGAPAGARGGGPPRGAGGIREGISYVMKDVTSRALLLLMAVNMALVFPFLAVLMAYYAKHVIGAGASGMGSIMSASGLGAMTGAFTLIASSSGSWRTRLWIGVLGMAAVVVALAYNRSLPLAVGLCTVLSFCSAMMLGTVTQTVQDRVPPELRGRVMALFAMAFTAVLPFSALALSALSDVVGYRRMMAACALLFGAIGSVLLVQMGRALAAAPGGPAGPVEPVAPVAPVVPAGAGAVSEARASLEDR
jgi:MFS family permease